MTDSSDLTETHLSSKVLKILCHLYEKVESLEAFAKGVISSESCNDAVIQSGDSASYISLLKSALVCTPNNARALPQTWLLQQHSHQDEVILRVIERIRLREGRNSTNLLVIGYRLMSDDSDALISSSRTIEYRIANSNTSRLQYTPWKTLLSRIGDDAMEFLLETRSVFVSTSVASTCYVQLTGTPMHELWPFHRYYAQNQRNPATQKLCTSLLNDSRYKAQKRRFRHRSNQRPCLSSTETDVSIKQLNESFSKASGADGMQQKTREKFNESEHVRSDHSADLIKQKCSENITTCNSAKKRKAEKVQLDGEPCEKVRIVTEPDCTDDSQCGIGLEANHVLSFVEYPLLHRQSPQTAQAAGRSQQRLSAHCRNQKRRRKRKGKLSDGNRKEHMLKTAAFEDRLLIERTPMFFSRDLREKYPPMYVQFDSDMDSPLKLVSDILAVRILYYDKLFSASCGDLECSREVKDRLLKLVKLICRNHQVCRYKYLLKHHCGCTNYSGEAAASSEEKTCEIGSGSLNTKSAPELHVPVYVRGKKTHSSGAFTSPLVSQEHAQRSKKSSVKMSVCHLLDQHCSHRAVFLFVRACSIRVLPTELFGSAANRNQFFRNVRKVIKMRRFEQMPLGCLMRSMKVTCCRWMKEIRLNTERLKLLAKVLSWLMTAFILPLVKSYFYVTDSATYRNRMFYYRKSLWKKIHQKGLSNYMQQGTLRKISPQEAKEKMSSGVTLGFASLRFMPKFSSLRPIINLSKKTKVAGLGSRESSINWQLIDLQNVLTYERQRCPNILGASVFSLDDIYAKWKKFVVSRHTRGDSRPLYFVKVDIENCYDSINQQKLYDVLSTVLQRDYVIRRYVSVVEAGGRLRRTYHRDATSLADLQPSFLHFVKDRIEDRGAHDTFFVDQVLHAHEDASSLLRKLRSHLFESIVKVGQSYFLQSQGIAQGSAVSSLLCNIYYGKMEASYITICEETELLMRQVDDFLYVTPSYENAVSFLMLMLRGIPEYNCRVNYRKTLVNFDLDSLEVDPVPRLATGALFPWCGLLIDTSTLAVVADYTRYAGITMSDTLTVNLAPNAGREMRNKLMFSLRTRCHRIFFDGAINPAAVQNVYRVFLLAAFKLHSYAAHLTRGPQHNPTFFVDIIFEVAGFVSSYTGRLATTTGGLLEGPALQWLCFEAFCQKLRRHGGVYGIVLSVISRRQMSLQRQLDECHLVELMRIVGDDLPADFQCMLP